MTEGTKARTQEVAGGHGATSAQARRATADLTAKLCPGRWPHPDRMASAPGTTGAPHEGLLTAPVPARSPNPSGILGKTSNKAGHSG